MELAAGVFIIMISFLHIGFGEKQPIAALSRLTDDSILVGSVRVMSLQGGVLLFAVGAVHLLSFLNMISLTGIAVYFPVGIICLNLLTFLLAAGIKHRELIKASLFQLAAFSIIIVLQVLAIKKV